MPHLSLSSSLRLLCCATPLLLSGCFGGGSAADALGSSLFNTVQGLDAPASIDCSADPFTYCTTQFAVRPNSRYVDANFNWQDEGAQKVVADFEKVKTDNNWSMTLTFKRDLAPGEYRGRIKLEVRNLPVADPFTTINPSYIAYRLVVGPTGAQFSSGTDLGRDWNGPGGNAAHDGYVDLKLDPASFKRRFSQRAPDNTSLQEAVTGSNRLVLLARSTLPSNPPPPLVYGLDEGSATQVWQSTLQGGNLGQIGSADGTLYSVSGNAASNAMTAFRLDSGVSLYAVLNQTSRVAPNYNPAAPVARNGLLCAGDGPENEIQCRNSSDGAVRYKLPVREALAARYTGFAPALLQNTVYANVGGKFYAWNDSDGSLQWSLDVPGDRSGTALDVREIAQQPQISGQYAVLRDSARLDGSAVDNVLSVVDLQNRKQLWRNSGQYAAPVVGNGMLYVVNQQNGALEAWQLASGVKSWSMMLPLSGNPKFYDKLGTDLVLTQNLLFASTAMQTFAIALETRQIRWTYPAGGRLLVSRQGVLYILARNPELLSTRDAVIAINLR